MNKLILIVLVIVTMMVTPAAAGEKAKPHPSPGQIAEQAQPEEWVRIAPDDLLVMDLALDRNGNARRVIIQLMPEPFSQGWVRNIRKLAQAGYWDGTAVIRVQDNYVAQWGDPAEEGKGRKALPENLELVPESGYSRLDGPEMDQMKQRPNQFMKKFFKDAYGLAGFFAGWPFGLEQPKLETPVPIWPVHCYGMVGVGRGLSPNTGDGSSLYTVIGHAPRHLDRNIALVGRVIEGIEHLSSLPRGTGPLGFYEKPGQRVPIQSVRLGNELEQFPQPVFEYLSTESETFARYAEARANRRDPFFIKPAGGADICNIPVPVRRVVSD